MLGHFRATGIKQPLIETISALGRLAVATLLVDFAVEVFNLVRIQNHDLVFFRAYRKGFRRVPGLRKSPGSTARRGWWYQSVMSREVFVNLRYAGIIGETRGESQHTAWTANCPKTVQKNGTKGYKKACFTAWSKGTAYTRDTFFTREKCVVPRARALCARALARAREHARNRSVYRFSANGQRTAKECGQIVVSRPGRPSGPRQGACTCRSRSSFRRSGVGCRRSIVGGDRLRCREASLRILR